MGVDEPRDEGAAGSALSGEGPGDGEEFSMIARLGLDQRAGSACPGARRLAARTGSATRQSRES